MIKTLAIDMDGVIADIEAQTILWYNRKLNKKVLPMEILGRPQLEAFPEKDAVLEIFNTRGFFRSLPPITGAIDALRLLKNKYQVWIVSSALEYPHSLEEKLDWLNEYLPFIGWRQIVFCGDKKIIHADALIDDYQKNLEYFSGIPLLFNALHNYNVKGIKRLNNWQEVRYFLDADALSQN